MGPFDLLQGLALIAALPGLILLMRLVLPRAGDGARLFRSPTDLGWPQGVQEEEPVRWHVELLGRRSGERPRGEERLARASGVARLG